MEFKRNYNSYYSFFIIKSFSHESDRRYGWSYVMTRKVNYRFFYRYPDEIVGVFCDYDEARSLLAD